MIDLELLALHEIDRNGMSVHLKPNTTAMMTPKLVDEIRALQDSLAKKYMNQSFDNYYVIWYLNKNINFSCCGLDFRFVHDCFKYNKEHDLEHYIDRIFNIIFLNYIGLGLPIINCSILTKYLSGLSKEFFLMSKICFIYQRKYKGLSKIEICNEIANLTFKKEHYCKNDYYFYNPIHIGQMKEIIENTVYEIPTKLTIEAAKIEFDAFKELMLLRLYKIASRDIKILDRFARNDIKRMFH
ncbi:hypothetical protein TUM19329_05300 [Legionella antarctica]|uniref:Uncharacterized protein n=1 Tax=Legionella antarctica TaxID=2708020 RepID=A0A6F8T155_9GAMM|nr:hypothetical protein [Legionella antarctica]BCA94169.1 hypothetical protein TUM19329_05300 [Legionella antarctica]